MIVSMEEILRGIMALDLHTEIANYLSCVKIILLLKGLC